MTEIVEQDLKSQLVLPQLGLLRTVNALKNLIARSRYACNLIAQHCRFASPQNGAPPPA